MTKTFCVYNNKHYQVNDTVCMEGHLAVCMPDGSWDKSAEACDKTAGTVVPSKLQASEPNVSTRLTSILFPQNVILAAQNAQKATGYLASVALAQWGIESGFGKYEISEHNPFSMKWHEGCEYSYTLVNIKEVQSGGWHLSPTKYIAFPSLTDAFLEQAKLLDPNGAYEKARSANNNYRRFIETIGTVHANEPNYIESLLSLIETYSLNRFDSIE
jgi:flagellum-specific peptidoglycan hydrolase FlgJ